MKFKHIALTLLLILPLQNLANKHALSSHYKEELNVIQNDENLIRFFAKLDKLLEERDGKVNILHIGDSHIQADVLTSRSRLLFQNTFGNGGRGFVFPYQIAKSNGPLDLTVHYSGNWSVASIMKNYPGHTIGASGYTAKAKDSATLFVKTGPYEFSNHSFNKLTIFQSDGYFVPTDSLESRAVAFGGAGNFPFATYLFKDYQDSISLRALHDTGGLVNLQGLSLENTEPGVVYHSMGTNGSSTLHYLRSNAFEKQMKALKADLIIISFGTNDCYLPYSRFCSSCTADRFRQLIRRIKKQNPNADILITTPPDHYYRRRYSNNNLQYLNRSLMRLAQEEQCAIWDLYSLMGGRGSISSWYYAGLARRDLIHFSKEGYKLQGTLLYQAVMKSYDGRFN